MKVRFSSLFLMALVCATAFSQEEKAVPPLAPLSSMVAITSRVSIPDRVAQLVEQYAAGKIPEEGGFPLPNTISDTVRSLEGTQSQVVVKWLDPLTKDSDADSPRFGANADFICFFGDGWDADWTEGAVGTGPTLSGDSTKGWIWVNHEYISNAYPTTTSAPAGQHLTYAQFLHNKGVMSDVTSDTWSQEKVDEYIRRHKTQVGGSWFRVVKNRFGQWYVDLDAENRRYDATSNTLATVTGYQLTRAGHDDAGNALAEGVTVGITGDCSGGQTPWGTVITAEENVQGYYGDFETCWTSRNRFVEGQGFDAGSMITFNPVPGDSDGQAFGRISDPSGRHDRDHYGFLTEIDPGAASNKYYETVMDGGDGVGHRKIGAAGRVRWENATVVTDETFSLIPGQPIVIYGGNDRRSGRIYKFVSNGNFEEGMNRAQVRALLDEGKVYAGHFAGLDHKTGITLYDAENPDGGGIVPTEEAPGQGRWILMDINNTEDEAPNAPALGAGTTVGAALQDVNWNGIGGFSSTNAVLGAMFTAANKLGLAELNRPEDLEWNPLDPSGTPRLYAAFTNHTRPAANNQQGVLDENTPSRADNDGSIFAIQEANASNAGSSKTFTYWRIWRGYRPDTTGEAALFAASDPDNLAIDKNGGLWFGTDGNAGSTGDTRSDAIYYLDMNPKHKDTDNGKRATYGKAFRVAASPGDSEATGPWFTPDGTTLFFNVQHPGEDSSSTPSTWPHKRDAVKVLGDQNVFKTDAK